MTHYQLITQNKFRSGLIMIGFVLFVVVFTMIITFAFDLDSSAIGLALVSSGITSLASYWWSDKLILSISKAKPATRSDHFDFFTAVENICLSLRTPMPKLYVIEDSAMNAFATGRSPDRSAICVTTGLLSRLNRAEIEGVISHELAHIQNYDMLLMSLVTVLVGFISLISDWLLRSAGFGFRKRTRDRENNQVQLIFLAIGFLLSLLSPLIAQLIKLALSRKREFLADSTGVSYTKNPAGLASALEKIAQDTETLEVANKATAHLYIANPLKSTHQAVGFFAKMFMTHPPIWERIKSLRQIS